MQKIFGSAQRAVRWLAVPACALAWGSFQAAEYGWDPAGAALYSQKNGGTALIIRREGMADFERYGHGCDSQTPSPVFSITKSLTALSCLSLRSLSPELVVRNSGSESPVTLRHLLSQTSGISPGYENLYKKNLPDVRKTAASLPSECPPGSRFVYGPSHYELIGGLLGAPGDSSDPARLVLSRFLDKLGIHPADWRRDRRGHIYLSAGAVLTPEDLLKLGRFVLDRGRVAGIWPLITREKFEMAFAGSQANPSYGWGFWLNRSAGHSTVRDIEEAIHARLDSEEWARMCLSNMAPPDLVCMAGSGGQRVYVIPSLRTVIVRLGRPAGFRDPEFLNALFTAPER